MKLQWRTFAEEYARNPTNPIAAYKKAYPRTKTDEGARVNATKLLKNVAILDLITTKRKEITTAADTLAINEIKEDRKYLFLSIADKREVLYKIAMGKLKLPIVDKNGDTIAWKRPEFQDRVKAIELDNEMTGDFVPRAPLVQNNIQNNNTGGNTTIARTVIFKTRKTTTEQTFETNDGKE